jgi:cell wall-associated NlpC family hydrolase
MSIHLPSWAGHYVGIPYEEIDCWHLVKLIYKEMFEVELDDRDVQADLLRDGFWIEVGNGYQAGDVLLFKSTDTERHVGVLLNYDYMIHADPHCGTVIDRWTARNWLPRLKGVYRCKALA